MNETLQIILGSSLVTALLSGLVTYFLHRKTQRINAEIKQEFEMLSQVQTTDFEWKKETLKILGQVYIHLNRTRNAFWNKYSKMDTYDPFYEDEILLRSNKYIRDILIENAHQIPPELLEDATKLIEHYDIWLTKYHKLRKVDMDAKTVQIYVGKGHDGFQFPDDAENKFKTEYIKLFKEIKNHFPADRK